MDLKYIDVVLMEYHNVSDELLDILKKYGFKCIRIGDKYFGMIYVTK